MPRAALRRPYAAGKRGRSSCREAGTITVRIAHVTWRLSTGGGIPVVIRGLLERMPAAEFEQHVVTVRPDMPEDGLDALREFAALHPLGYSGGRGASLYLGAARAISRTLRRLQPDVVHTHSGTAWLTLPWGLRDKGAARLLEVHDAPRRGRHGPTSEWLEGMMMRRLGYVPLVHSTSVRDDVERVNRIPAAEVRLVPLGIETARFASPSTNAPGWRAARGIPTERHLVLYVARLVSTKNLPLFIEVARRITAVREDTVFAVVASGKLESELQAQIDAQGLSEHVKLVGACFGDDLVDAYHAADVYLSTSDYEGFGLSIVEAMSAGLPVVATGVGGVRDLVEEGDTGILTDRGDAAALADGVASLLEDPALRARMGKAGGERAHERFDADALAAGVADVYRALAGRA